MSSQLNAIIHKIKETLVSRFELGLTKDDISDNELIFDDGLGLDSMSAIELVVAIEETFDIVIGEEDLTADKFRSVKTLAKLIHLKTHSGLRAQHENDLFD